MSQDKGSKDKGHNVRGIIQLVGVIGAPVLTAILVIVFTPVGEQIKNYLFPPPIVIPPETTITSVIDEENKNLNEGDSTYSTYVKFMFNGTDDKQVLNFQCSLQDQEFRSCTSPEPKGGLKPGFYVFRVKAIDSDQAEDPSPDMFSLKVLTSALVEGSIQERNRPAPNLKLELDNKTDSSTDVIGKFFFQKVPGGGHKYWIYDKLNNPLVGPITFFIAEEEFIKNLGVIALDLIQPVSFGQTSEEAPDRVPSSRLGNADTLPSPLSFDLADNETELQGLFAGAASNMTINYPGTNAVDGGISLMHEAKVTRESSIHNVTVWVNGAQQELAEIERVTYYLHPSFQPNVVTRSSSEDGFALSFSAWGQFTLKASIFFRDGEVKELSRFISFSPTKQ